eukprot:2738801-Rhodomonas_salina.1
METDAAALQHSGRMLKAARNNILILVASGIDAQLAWTSLPRPFENFSDLLLAAGGSLGNILQTQLS